MTIAFPQEETRSTTTTPTQSTACTCGVSPDACTCAILRSNRTCTPQPKPISQKKLEANRNNAKKSTGPRTQAGKAKVSQNARTHGLSSQQAPDSTNPTFCQAHEELKEELRPITPIQHILVKEIAHITWKLDQIPKIEFQLLNTALPGSDLSLPTPPAHNPHPLSAIPPVIAAHFLENTPTPLTRIYNHQLRLQSKLTSLLHHLREAKKAHRKQEAEENQIESDRQRSRRIAKDKAALDEELNRMHQNLKQKEEQDRAQRLEQILEEKRQQKQTQPAPAATPPHPAPTTTPFAAPPPKSLAVSRIENAPLPNRAPATAPMQIKPTDPASIPQKPTILTPPTKIKPTAPAPSSILNPPSSPPNPVTPPPFPASNPPSSSTHKGDNL